MRRRSRQQGFALLDYTVGMSLAGLALLLMSWSVTEQRRAGHVLAQKRAAMRAAELAVSCLLTGESLPDDVKFSITTDDAPAPTSDLCWAKISAVMPSGQRAELIAAVPKSALASHNTEGQR